MPVPVGSIWIGDGQAQREISIEPNVEYEIKLEKNGMLCESDHWWRCSLNMALNKMKCNAGSMTFQVFTDDRDPESVCKNFDGYERLSFEAHDQIRVMASGNASTTDFVAAFTISTILRMTSTPHFFIVTR